MKKPSSFFKTLSLFSIVVTQTILSQTIRPETTIKNLMFNESIPVSQHTGIPSINIPIYSIPTRSSEITMNVGLGYHPSGAILFTQSGNVGDVTKGWSLFSGGVISRTVEGNPDEVEFKKLTPDPNELLKTDLYQYNFMGQTGRFKVVKDSNGNLFSYVLNNEGRSVIDLTFNSTTFEVNSFTIFDDKGYKYVFTDVDKTNSGSFYFNSAYHLTQVIDNNGQELIHFNYNNLLTTHNDPLKPTIYKKISQITVAGIAKVDFVSNGGTGIHYKLNEILLKDLNSTTVKKFKFYRDVTDTHLDAVEMSNLFETSKDKYTFTYKEIIDSRTSTAGPTGLTEYAVGPDYWGYQTIYRLCDYDYIDGPFRTSSTYCTNGVLEKMTLPTGGYITYDYESNTYSDYIPGTIPDTAQYTQNDRNFVDDSNVPPFNPYDPANIFKVIDENLVFSKYNLFFLNTVQGIYPLYEATFTVTSTAYHYFHLNNPGSAYDGFGNQLYNPDGSIIMFYPNYTLSSDTGFYEEFRYHDEKNRPYNDPDYRTCLGKAWLLPPGNYKLEMHGKGWGTSPQVSSKKIVTNPVLWHYGGGIRIQSIKYYDGISVTPVNEVSYKYNYFDTNATSGSIENFDENFSKGGDLVTYKYVEVSSSKNKGKERFTYTSFLDGYNKHFVEDFKIFNLGVLTNKKIYNSNNDLLQDIDFNYIQLGNYIVPPAGIPSSIYGPYFVYKKTTNNFFSTSVLPITTVENFYYNDINLKIDTYSTTNSIGETIKTEYKYQIGIDLNTKNRISELKEVKSYKGTTMLSSHQVVFSNILTPTANTVYLPQSIKKSKGNNPYETQMKFNSYDEFNNLLEEEQENGIKTAYIWGYNKTQIIAKVENAAYNDILSKVANLQTLSNADINTASETTLRNALNGLRTNFPYAMITTYTYDPLIGLTSVTDPKGDQITYSYDTYGRQQYIKDKDGNILSENEYHFPN